MRGPGWRGDEIAVGNGFGHGEIDVGTACLCDVGTDGRIGAALLPFQDACCGKDLRGVADGGNRLIGLGKVVNDFDDTRIEANIFGCAATGEDESVVLFGLDLVERGVESEIVTALFGVGLIPFEIMDSGSNELTGFLARANSVNRVP